MRATAELTALGAVAAAGLGAMAWILLKSRRDPRERERRRRKFISRYGRMGDGCVNDVTEDSLYYSYTVHGVDYSSSQDISTLRELLPESLDSVVGPVTLKFLPASPENSIVIGEDWFGVRSKSRNPQLLKGA